MQITCPHCSSSYSVASERIPPQGVSIKCPTCTNSFEVHPPAPAAATGIPLPGQGAPSGIPLPGQGAPSGIPLPGQGAPSGIPLPGQGAAPFPAAAPAAPAAAGIPLPGQGAPSGIPLPGQGASPAPFPAAPAAGGIPLPGQGQAATLPHGVPASGGIPLPGQGETPAPAQGFTLPQGSPAAGGIPLPGQGATLPHGASPPAAGIPLPGQGSPSGIPLPGQGAANPPSETLSFGAFVPPDQSGSANAPIPSPFGATPAPQADASLFDSPDKSPFHGNNSIVLTDSPQSSGVDFISPQSAPAATQNTYRLRKRTGEISGPFDEQTVLQMFSNGELNGSEEVTTDNFKWHPIAQVPAFAATVQRAMAEALGGLGDGLDLPALRNADVDLPGLQADLPTPVEAGLPAPVAAGLPTPVAAGLPTPSPPAGAAPAMQKAPAVAAPFGNPQNLPTPKIDLGAPIASQPPAQSAPLPGPAKAKKEKVKKEKKGGGKGVAALALGGLLVAGVAGAGAYTHFMTEHGAFGYKTFLGQTEDPVVLPPKKDPPPKKVVQKKPPEIKPGVPAAELLAKDDYVPYYQGAKSFKAAALAGKGQTPIPKSARDAAAEAARMNAYLVVVEKMEEHQKDLADMVPLASPEHPGKLIGEAALAYSSGSIDKGIDLLKDASSKKDTAKGDTLAEIQAWTAVGYSKKNEGGKALKAIDAAIKAAPQHLFAMYQRASILKDEGEFEESQKQIDALFAIAPKHTRSRLLSAGLLALDPDKKAEGKKVLSALAESEGDVAAAPQRARAFFGLADIAAAEEKWDEASDAMNKGIALVPNNRQFLKEHAEFSLRLRNFDEAKKSFDKIRAAFPKDKSVVVGLARANMQSGETQNALKSMEAASKAAPKDAELMYWYGVAAQTHTKFSLALEKFNAAAKLDPGFAAPVAALVKDKLQKGKIKDALEFGAKRTKGVRKEERHILSTEMAQAHLAKRDLEAASKVLARAIKSAPRYVTARLTKTKLLIEQNNLEAAAKEVALITSFEPRNPKAIAMRGLVKALQNDLQAGIKDFETATTMSENDHEIFLFASQAALKNNEIARAKGFVDSAEALRKDFPDVRFMRAMVLKASDPQLAVQTLQEAFETSPDNPRIQYELGRTYQVLNRHLEAKDAFKKALKQDDDFNDARFALAMTYRELGRDSFAKREFKKVISKDKKRAGPWIELARMSANAGNPRAAVRALNQAVKAEPQSADAVCDRGMMLVRQMGDSSKFLKQGVTSLERCVRLVPKHNGGWLALGDAYRDLKQKAKAIRAYKKHSLIAPAEAATVCETLQLLGAKCD